MQVPGTLTRGAGGGPTARSPPRRVEVAPHPYSGPLAQMVGGIDRKKKKKKILVLGDKAVFSCV